MEREKRENMINEYEKIKKEYIELKKERKRTKSRLIIHFCREFFKTSNIIGTDIQDVCVKRIERKFEQDDSGYRISFSISNHIVGKSNLESHEALEILLSEKDI